jgi:taurine--2-oxoglutarate transaminase
VYEDEKVFENVERQGAYLAERLEAMRAKYACVGDARYKGLFSMLELVRDKNTKEPLVPYGGSSSEMSKLGAHFKSNHLHTYVRFNTFFIAPPLIITREELKYGLDIIEGALAEVDQALGA